MTRHLSPRLPAYAAIAAAALLGGLALGRVELVALAAPFALAAVAAPAFARPPKIRGRVALDRERALESETVAAAIELTADAAERVDVVPSSPPGWRPRAATRVRSRSGPTTHERSTSRSDAIAGAPISSVRRFCAPATGSASMPGRCALGGSTPLRVYPTVEALHALLPPLETQVFVGDRVTRTKGDGIEFADIRAWAAGDRPRRVNWRATARRGELWVNERHPERNTDVVLFLDTFTDARLGRRGTLDLTVRAATSLAHRYLQRKDRVGLVSFGGFLSWLLPTSGTRQLYRIVDSLSRWTSSSASRHAVWMYCRRARSHRRRSCSH